MARVSLTSSVIRAKTVSAATFLSSAESYTQIKVKKSHKHEEKTSNIYIYISCLQIGTSSATNETGSFLSSLSRTMLTTA